MARFVRFGGAPYKEAFFTLDGASYLSTPDVNLLDADTAHIEQSKGGWDTWWGALVPIQSTDYPMFGGYSLKCEVNIAQPVVMNGTGLWDSTDLPVSPGTVITLSADVLTPEAGLEHALGIRWLDSSDASLGDFFGTYTPIGTSVSRHSLTETAPANTAGMQIFTAVRVVAGGNNTPGDNWYLGKVTVAEGSDPTFVPSLRVLQNLDMVSVVDPDDWSIGTDQMIINFRGTGATNSGYQQRVGPNAEPSAGMSGDAWRLVLASPLVPEPTLQTKMRSFIDNLGGSVEFSIDDVFYESVPFPANETPVFTEPELRVGNNAALARPFAGGIARAVVMDGGDGPAVASFDASDYGGSAGAVPDGATFTDSVTGRIWTVNGTGVTYTPTDFGDSVTVPIAEPSPKFIVKNPIDMPDRFAEGLWIVGDGWVGDGYTATLHAGTDASGPIVARFNAEDVGL